MKKFRYLLVLAILVVIAVFLIINHIHPQNEYHLIGVSTKTFTEAGNQVKLGIKEARATETELSVSLTLSGLDLENNPNYLENLICVPYIQTKQNVGVQFASLNVLPGEPNTIEYNYILTGNKYNNLDVEMDWTIGPCGTSINESNATPMPEPLLVNYHFNFSLPVDGK